MKKYLGVKIIEAEPMYVEAAEDHLDKTISASSDKDGYLVKYEDGYESWSPKDVFDKAYRPIENLTFGLAIEALKKGLKVARLGWNGANMFAYYVKSARCPAMMDVVKGVFGNDEVPYREYLALKTAQGDVATWAPSTSDCLAEDWFIVE